MRCIRAVWLPSRLAALIVFGVLASAPGARALDANEQIDANGQLENPVLQARFENIAKNLRCLVCQNESVADSNAQLAGDLRRQVRDMLVAGRSDDEIYRFMTDRYGEFVRFNPPLEAKTLLIWGAPFILLVIGAGVVFRVVRQRSRMPLDDEPSPGPL
jgi:cytochrome c-type biogenesis protein CcmH